MNNAERLALAAILMKLKPACSIFIGNSNVAALALLQQYSAATFSLGADSATANHSPFPRISFLPGSATTLLPLLLQELQRDQMDPEFFLIDAPALTADPQTLLAPLLNTPPRKPIFILIRGNAATLNHHASEYIHRIDPHFIPPSPGPTGGLTAIYLAPTKRTQPFAAISS